MCHKDDIMRNIITFFSVLVLLYSCSESESESTPVNQQEDVSQESVSKEVTKHDLIARRWRYNERTISESEEVMKFGDESSDVILRLEPNGFFMIYDSITNQDIIDKGIKRIEQRSSGQWDLIGDDVLILRKIESDTIIIDSLKIEKLDDNSLVTETKNRNKITYFSID